MTDYSLDDSSANKLPMDIGDIVDEISKTVLDEMAKEVLQFLQKSTDSEPLRRSLDSPEVLSTIKKILRSGTWEETGKLERTIGFTHPEAVEMEFGPSPMLRTALEYVRSKVPSIVEKAAEKVNKFK